MMIVLFKNANTGSNNTIQEKDDKQRIKYVPQIKDGTPVLQNEVAPGNVAKKKKKKKKKSEGKVKKKVVNVFGDSMIKNLDSREISTSNLFKFD